MRGKQTCVEEEICGPGWGKEEWSRERRRLIENSEGVAVKKEVASRNCQSAGILRSHRGGEM